MADDGEENTKKECKTCKPTTVSQKDNKINLCNDSYDTMKSCMSKFKGNISSCKAEWIAFRVCFEKTQKSVGKSFKYDGRRWCLSSQRFRIDWYAFFNVVFCKINSVLIKYLIL